MIRSNKVKSHVDLPPVNDGDLPCEEELAGINEKLLFHLETTPLGFIEWDKALFVTAWSKRAQKIFGWTAKEMVGSYKSGLLQVHEDNISAAAIIAEELISGAVDKNSVKQRNITKGGKIIWCEWFNSVVKGKSGKVISIMSLVQDITPKVVAEEKISRVRRLTAFSSQLNKNITRIKDEATLFRNSCAIALQFDRFKMAWIGMFNKADQTITLVSQSGVPPREIELFTEAPYRIDGPQNHVLRTGKHFVSNDIQNDPGLPDWKEYSILHNIHSCILLPIRKAESIVGTFNLYSSEAGFFDREEIDLLVEVADDISFATNVFDRYEKQKDTELQVVNNEKKFRHALDNMLEGIQMHDFDWRYIYINDAAVKFGPFSRKEMIGYTLMEKYPGIEQSELFGKLQECMQQRVTVHFATQFEFPDGTQKYFELSINPIPEGISILSVDRTEQEISKELVLKNEIRFRAIIENSTDMLTLTTREGIIMYGSPSIRKVLGYSQREVPQMSGLDFIHPDDLQGVLKNRNGIIDVPNASYTHEVRLKHKSGKWIWCEVTSTNMLDMPGLNAIVANFRDISERKETEQALAETENLIQTIYAASLDAVIIINSKGIITKWDDKSEELFGWKEHEVKGTELSEKIIPERYRSLHDQGMRHYLETGESNILGKTAEVRALRKDNTEFDVSLSISASQINEQICFIGFIRDISEKKAIEAQRAFDKNNLRALINNTPDLMWSVDLDLNLITFNLPFQKLIKMGSGRDILQGDNVMSMSLSAEQLAYFKELYKRAFSGETFTVVEYIDTPYENWSEISYCPIRQGDEIIGAACQSRDVTERKVAEAVKEKITKDLIQRNIDLEQFAYIISHNLRAPVANILGASSMLDEPDLADHDKKALMQGLNESVLGLDNVVKDLNRILQVKLEINDIKERVCFSTLVEEIKISIKKAIVENDISITYDFEETDELFILKSYAYSIFYNLISNSIKYRREGIPCLIKIKSVRSAKKTKLIFTDNGLGIDLKKRGEQVFGLYKRFHMNIEGKGMGLYMVKTQVETLGGTISLRSKVNMGTKFTIAFPAEL